MTAFAAGVCVALVAYLSIRPSPSIERLGRPPRVPAPRVARTPTPRIGLLAGGALGGCLVLAGFGWPGVAIGAVAGLGLRTLLRRAEPRAVLEVREALRCELPWVLDLLTATIAGRHVPPRLVWRRWAFVLVRSGSVTGARLAGVAARLRLGAATGEAWAPALADGGEALAPVAEAYAAATADGSHLSARLAAQAQAAREVHATEALAAAERAGVRAVLPLGLCYLPALRPAGDRADRRSGAAQDLSTGSGVHRCRRRAPRPLHRRSCSIQTCRERRETYGASPPPCFRGDSACPVRSVPSAGSSPGSATSPRPA